MRVRELTIGISAALSTPLWIAGSRLQHLLHGATGCSQVSDRAKFATRISRRTLQVLGRPPLIPWRNTCLYRSVAECLVLRSCGIGYRLKLGVSGDAASGDSIVAHAWVERGDQTDPDDSHILLRPSS